MPYQPISCDYHDELTLLAVRKKNCTIVYQHESGTNTVHGVIKDIYTRNKEEFLLLSGGQEIRLDRLVSVDGKELSDYC